MIRNHIPDSHVHFQVCSRKWLFCDLLSESLPVVSILSMESQLAKLLEDGGVNHTTLSVLAAEYTVDRGIFVALRKEHLESLQQRVTVGHHASLVPRLSCVGGGERAWYTLFAHVPSSLGNLHTTPLH